MKFFKEITLVAATTLLSGLSTQASASSMVELTYQASQYQCGAGASQSVILVDVYHNGELVKDGLAVGESVMVPDFAGVELDYEAATGSCGFNTFTSLLLDHNGDVPSLAGAFNQEAISSLVTNLKEYEELFLVELGTADTNSVAYDLQDVVIVIDSDPEIVTSNNPLSPIVFAD